jgi:putative transposase
VAERPNQKWIADFTYIWTAEGWLYIERFYNAVRRQVPNGMFERALVHEP